MTNRSTTTMKNSKRLRTRDMRRKLGFAAKRAGYRHIPANHIWEKFTNGLRLVILEAGVPVFTAEVTRNA